MKRCTYCQENILDDAIKCRYCGSMLVSLPQQSTDAEKKQITYIVDKDLLRFAKFSGSVLAIFALIGAFLYGFDIKQAAKEIKDAQEEAKKTNKEIQEAKVVATKLTEEASSLLGVARTHVASISKSSDEARGIVAASLRNKDELETLRSQIETLLTPVLTADQLKSLRANATKQNNPSLTTIEEVSRLVQADVTRATNYFVERGLKLKTIRFEISKDRQLQNAFWDGSKIVFGMGMVNSDVFGPYESGIILHEATHALFNIKFEGQSGSIAEHVCDVMAVAMRGGDWSIGRIRSSNPAQRQVLRSLSTPGSAYDSPILGKDPQVSHMRNFASGAADNGQIHINNGILNKAAFLISEGGEFSGIKVPGGLGRERLGKLYASLIVNLSSRPEWTFVTFRDLVLKTAKDNSYDDDALKTIQQSFAAVGL